LEKGGTFGYNELLTCFFDTGVSSEKIKLFLETDLTGKGALRDRIVARMTNEIMEGLGTPSTIDSEKAKKIREEIKKLFLEKEVPE